MLLPRSKKPLEFDSNGTYDKAQWTEIARQSGPAARTGDSVRITKVEIEADRIVLDLNGGFSGGRKWYHGVRVSGGMGGGGDAGSHLERPQLQRARRHLHRGGVPQAPGAHQGGRDQEDAGSRCWISRNAA